MIRVEFSEPSHSPPLRAVAGARVTFSGDAGVFLRRVSGRAVAGNNFTHTGADDSYYIECVYVGPSGTSVGTFSVSAEA